MPTKKEIVKSQETTPDGKVFQYIGKNPSKFESHYYTLKVNSPSYDVIGKHYAYIKGAHKTLKEFQNAQKKKLPSYKEQMAANKKCIEISGIETSALMVGKFTLKNGEMKTLLICPTQQKEFGLCANMFSGIVNDRLVPDKRLSPISYTLYNTVHEQLLLWDKNDEAIRINFELEPYQILDHQRINPDVSLEGNIKPWPIFGFNDFKKTIKAIDIGIWEILWLHGMLVSFHNAEWMIGEQHICYYDPYSNSLRVIEQYLVEIDLREVTLTSSGTSYKNGRSYKEFFDGQGEDSHLILLPLKDPFGEIAYKPDSHSKTGLVQVAPPAMLSKDFNTFNDPPCLTRIHSKKKMWATPIALTNGDWIRSEHV